MIRPLRSASLAWPAMCAAVAYGVVEWLALSRSRAADRLLGWRRSITRQ